VYKNEGDPPLANPLGHGSFVCDSGLRPDIYTHAASVRDVYEAVGDFDGPFTTPCLVDKTSANVSNESMEILAIR
jgi:glutathionyl-hydroquinone reductase